MHDGPVAKDAVHGRFTRLDWYRVTGTCLNDWGRHLVTYPDWVDSHFSPRLLVPGEVLLARTVWALVGLYYYPTARSLQAGGRLACYINYTVEEKKKSLPCPLDLTINTSLIL